MKPICVPCQRFYRPKKNGVYFVEGMPMSKDAKPGIEDAELWKPYKLWCGDRWVCHGCNAEIIVGTGMRPIAERHEDDFAAKVRSFSAALQINDC